jgi:hypothetical protein
MSQFVSVAEEDIIRLALSVASIVRFIDGMRTVDPSAKAVQSDTANFMHVPSVGRRLQGLFMLCVRTAKFGKG